MTSTSDPRFLIDTNVLLRIVSQLPDHGVGNDLRRLLGSSVLLCITQQSLFEFWTVFTRPVSANGLGETPQEAVRIVGLLRAVFEVLADPPDLLDRWLSICEQHQISGRPAHDARQVAVADAHGITQIVTSDPGHFQRFKHLKVIDPKAGAD